MLYRFFRDSYWGVIINKLSHHKYFPQKEELPGYVIPEKYLQGPRESSECSSDSKCNPEKECSEEVENKIIVTWDGEDDMENPQNWPRFQKAIFMFNIFFLTISVYIGSAIYTPGIEEVMHVFDVDQNVATLPLTCFVVGYGTSIFLPLSESAKYGRTLLYITTLFAFFILQIGTAYSQNIQTLCILRFLAGVFGSPCLGTGNASMGDILPISQLLNGVALWSISAISGPSLGPVIGGALVNKWNWRAPFWFMVCSSGVSFLIFSFFLPETYGKTLLYRKAIRLRALTGNENIISEGEIEDQKHSTTDFFLNLAWRPFEIMFFEPMVLLIDIYTSLMYALMYTWFEAFPLLYMNTYGFTLVESGVVFLVLVLSQLIGTLVYIPIITRTYTQPLVAGKEVSPEVFLPLSIVGSILMPIGLFMFGWSGTNSAHWIVSIIGAGIFGLGAFFVFQTLFNYLAFSFTHYLASVFAGNNMMRSTLAAFFPIIGRYAFNNLAIEKFPVAWGSTVLGCITTVMILIPTLFYINGPKLRARSKYSNINQ